MDLFHNMVVMRKLHSYKKSEIVYDGTVYFCTRFFLKKRQDDRPNGSRLPVRVKQNIAEASNGIGDFEGKQKLN